MLKGPVKIALRKFGYKIEKIAPLEETIRADYNQPVFRWPGATKAIDEFVADKAEQVPPHWRCTWQRFVVTR